MTRSRINPETNRPRPAPSFLVHYTYHYGRKGRIFQKVLFFFKKNGGQNRNRVFIGETAVFIPVMEMRKLTKLRQDKRERAGDGVGWLRNQRFTVASNNLVSQPLDFLADLLRHTMFGQINLPV